MSLQFYSVDCNSQFKMEDYFPLILLFNTNCDSPRRMGFYYGNTDLLEVIVDDKGKVVNKIVLVLCHHFTTGIGSLSISDFRCKKGTLAMEIPRRTECDFFSVTLFDDGIKVSTSTKTAQAHFQMGQVVFGFDENERMVELMCKLSEKELLHCKKELNIMNLS